VKDLGTRRVLARYDRRKGHTAMAAEGTQP
jgi:hypothetical protein